MYIRDIKDSNNTLCHIVIKNITDVDKENDRLDIIPAEEFLQLSILAMPKEKTFRPHKHIEKNVRFDKMIAQESWVVINGGIGVHYYDENNKLIESHRLRSGDVSITLRGGHNYTVLQHNTFVLEFKTGPYEGQERDKIFIDNDRS